MFVALWCGGTASTSPLNPGASPFSLAAWVRVEGNGGGSSGGKSSAIGFGDCCPGGAPGALDRHAFEFGVDGGATPRPNFGLDTRGTGGGEIELQPTSGTTLNTWRHIVGVKRADGTAEIYFDEVSLATGGGDLGALAPDGTDDGADGDIDIDITDFNILASNFDDTAANSATNDWTTADFDADGDVDITDFNFLAANFADTGYGGGVLGGQVPEPTAWLLLILGVAGGWLGLRGRR